MAEWQGVGALWQLVKSTAIRHAAVVPMTTIATKTAATTTTNN